MKQIAALFFALMMLSPLAAFTIDDVCASLSSHGVTAGDFVQEKSLPNTSRKLKSSGTFIFCDRGVVWHTKKPVSSVMVVEESRIVQTMPDGKKSVIDGSQNDIFKSSARTISSVFKGDKTSLETFFSVTFSADNEMWKMELFPRDSVMASAIKKIVLSGAFGADASFDSMEILQGNNLSVSYFFSNQHYREELSNEEKKYFE